MAKTINITINENLKKKLTEVKYTAKSESTTLKGEFTLKGLKDQDEVLKAVATKLPAEF